MEVTPTVAPRHVGGTWGAPLEAFRARLPKAAWPNELETILRNAVQADVQAKAAKEAREFFVGKAYDYLKEHGLLVPGRRSYDPFNFWTYSGYVDGVTPVFFEKFAFPVVNTARVLELSLEAGIPRTEVAPELVTAQPLIARASDQARQDRDSLLAFFQLRDEESIRPRTVRQLRVYRKGEKVKTPAQEAAEDATDQPRLCTFAQP